MSRIIVRNRVSTQNPILIVTLNVLFNEYIYLKLFLFIIKLTNIPRTRNLLS